MSKLLTREKRERPKTMPSALETVNDCDEDDYDSDDDVDDDTYPFFMFAFSFI